MASCWPLRFENEFWFAEAEVAGIRWVPPGHVPTVEEAQERLEHLDAYGPTPQAFTFKRRFAYSIPGDLASGGA